LINNLLTNPEAVAQGGEFQTMLFNNPSSLTTAIAYKFNLKGPSYTIQTFCSTSLVAVHVACQSLLNFECDMAVAGGVAITVPQKAGYWYREGLILSPDGYCRPFDSRARGTVFGNGLGAVVLKRLEDALADGDHIEGKIIGTATNNDGSLKVSYGAPSVSGQAEVIVEAMANADVEPETITYVEAHGTGTALGDPAEVSALTQAYRSGSRKRGFCALGSVKANIGHLDTAAGVAGLIKTVQALKHRTLPPSLHFESPNPDIDFDSSPFYVNREALEWKSEGSPRRAGVSSFGIGGTNAHVIVEEAPQRGPSGPSRPWRLLVLSARTKSALDTATSNLCKYLGGNPGVNLSDVAYTLGTGRKAFNQRRFVVCQDVKDAARALESQVPGHPESSEVQQRDPDIAFLFPDEGLLSVNRGRTLYEQETVFREAVDQCCSMLRQHLGRDLRELLYPKEGDAAVAGEDLCKESVRQPALFTLEFALAKLWNSWGVQQQAAVGYGIGEYVAACLGEVWSLQDALMLVAMRGRMMEDLSEDGAEAVPTEKIAESFNGWFKDLKRNPPTIPLVSSVAGTWMTPEQAADPAYWANQVRGEVRFSEVARRLREKPDRVLLMVGPATEAAVLAQAGQEDTVGQGVIPSLNAEVADGEEWSTILQAVGRLWLRGVSIDWAAYYEGEKRSRVELPTYPFERKRFWVEPAGRLPGAQPEAALPGTSYEEGDILDLLMTEDVEARRRMLMGMLKELLEKSSGLDPAGIEESVTFLEMGLDSLFLTRWTGLLKTEFNVEISMTELLDGVATLGRLTDFLEKELVDQYEDVLQEIDGLSDEEVDRLLDRGEDDD
jgi:acyl transferase domain-containing protein